MKIIRFALALFAATAAARAETITLTDGRVFADAKILSQTPTHVTVRHGAGMIQIAKTLLRGDLRAKYPVDEAAAAAAKKKDAEFKETRLKAAKENEATHAAKLAAQRADALAQEEEQKRAMAAIELSGEFAEKVVSALFEVYPPNRNTPMGLYGVKVFFCIPEQWRAHQQKRRHQFEDEYKKQCALIHAQGYDVDGYSLARRAVWEDYYRWYRSTHEEVPEHFANAKTAANGTIIVPVLQRPFVMFARSERTQSEGWDTLVWVEQSSAFKPGVQRKFSYRAALDDEPWTALPRGSPLKTNVQMR